MRVRLVAGCLVCDQPAACTCNGHAGHSSPMACRIGAFGLCKGVMTTRIDVVIKKGQPTAAKAKVGARAPAAAKVGARAPAAAASKGGGGAPAEGTGVVCVCECMKE